jgi:hypothetical protein
MRTRDVVSGAAAGVIGGYGGTRETRYHLAGVKKRTLRPEASPLDGRRPMREHAPMTPRRGLQRNGRDTRLAAVGMAG